MKASFSKELHSARGWILGFVALVLLLGLSNKALAGERLVVIDGSLTEIVYALGSGAEVVGRDLTSNYPPEVNRLPSVGYMRQLSAEGILSLNPSLVLVTDDAEPQKVLKQLEDSGIRLVTIDNRFTLDGVKHKILQVGKALGKEPEARSLAAQMLKQVEQAQADLQSISPKHKARALFTMGIRNGNLMVAGRDTRADEMLRLAGVDNIPAKMIKGYKPLTAESAILFNPQYLITMQHGLKASGGREAMLSGNAVKLTDAGKHRQLVVMDNSFLTFGPRIGEAVQSLVDTIYRANKSKVAMAP
ncbi:heme/hemin ABC transporter substrate-binding protein [Thiomicrorhabdus heinhorstiae]|uniref:ABC transporter substrate-binding protein n=1 Tax=Thiomicrorhabdus heinhorstiae TaxID=2748010 RepID=A0ABS0C1C2_9GAMM|nr:ABC transporter substrate-binding protein [Thiomicrorhabdus heinhorstiae]MBF6058127.1 ABC transporter substrate-binding protein [Thiomicrorhabdus heinhorstiae]